MPGADVAVVTTDTPSSGGHEADGGRAPAQQTEHRPDLVARLAHLVIPLSLLAGVLLLMVRLAARPLDNFDTYFHLRFGREFLSGAWSLRDPGSVSSFATADWVPTQWLPQVLMAQVEQWFGLAGVAWLSGLMFLALALTFYTTARRVADPLISVVLVALALYACAMGMSMRPQVISYILVAVTTSLWLRAGKTGRPPWLLVPLTWVWAMCHGMWPIGIVIGLVAVAGARLDRAPVGTLRLLAVPALSAVAGCCTPVGPRLFEAVLLVSSRGKYFSEWAAPEFTHPSAVTLLVLLGIPAVVIARRSSTWTDLLLLTLAAAWALYSLRTVPVAASMLVPLAAAQVQRLAGPRSAASALERRFVGIAFAGALALLALQVPSSANEPLDQPSWVDDELAALPQGTKMLSDTGHGGFLMWRFPQLDLVQHGYGDTFTTAELDRNAAISNLDPGWLSDIRETEVTHAVLDPEDRLAYALRELAGWLVVESSPTLQLLVPPPDWQDPPAGS